MDSRIPGALDHEHEWDDFLSNYYNARGPEKGWIESNPLESVKDNTGKQFDTFDRTIDTVDAELHNPDLKYYIDDAQPSLGNRVATPTELLGVIGEKIGDCDGKKGCKRLYSSLKGYQGDTTEVINRAQLLIQARDKPFELILRIGDTLHTIKKD